MRKQWRFLCPTSPTLDPSTGKYDSSGPTLNTTYLTMFRISDSSIQFPVDCIKVLRSRPFAFSARRCNKFSVDRVLLAGDAAHVFPPCKCQPDCTPRLLTRDSWRTGDCFRVQRCFWPCLAPGTCHPREHEELRPPFLRLVRRTKTAAPTLTRENH